MRIRHPPEVRDRVMGALYASADWSTGEPLPNLSGVAEAEGLPVQTVHRWWQARDKAEDGKRREGALRAREAVAEEGARDWLRRFLGELRTDMETLRGDSPRWKAARVDEASRAIVGLTRAAKDIAEVLDVAKPGDGEGDSVSLDAGVRAALERSRGGASA